MKNDSATLRAMLETIPELDQIELPIGGPAVTFDAKQDTCGRGFGVGIFRDSDMGIMRGFMAQGNTIVSHRHQDSYEWVGVARGTMELSLECPDELVILSSRDAVLIAAGRPHSSRAITDLAWWSVTMPPARGYPTVEICPLGKEPPLR